RLMKANADSFLRNFAKIRRTKGGGYQARCPAHPDKVASLSISRGKNDDRWVLKCFAGCDVDAILAAVGLKKSDLFDESVNGEKNAPWSGSTLAEYARAKALPIEFLRSLGLSDIKYFGKFALRIPYYSEAGAEVATRYRVALGGDRFRWKKGC